MTAQELDAGEHTLQIVARAAGRRALGGADGEVDRLVAVRAQRVERHVLADLNAEAELHAELLEHVDLRVDNVLLEAEARDAEREHTAGHGLLLKHGHGVALDGEVVRAAQTGRAGRPIWLSIFGTKRVLASRSFSAMNFLMSSMAIGSSMLPRVQASSQRLLQMRPQTAGNGFSFLMSSSASV